MDRVATNQLIDKRIAKRMTKNRCTAWRANKIEITRFSSYSRGYHLYSNSSPHRSSRSSAKPRKKSRNHATRETVDRWNDTRSQHPLDLAFSLDKGKNPANLLTPTHRHPTSLAPLCLLARLYLADSFHSKSAPLNTPRRVFSFDRVAPPRQPSVPRYTPPPVTR